MPASQTGTFRRVGYTGWSAFRFKDPTFPVWIGAAILLVFLMLLPLGAILLSDDFRSLRALRTRFLDWVERRHPSWLGQ